MVCVSDENEIKATIRLNDNQLFQCKKLNLSWKVSDLYNNLSNDVGDSKNISGTLGNFKLYLETASAEQKVELNNMNMTLSDLSKYHSPPPEIWTFNIITEQPHLESAASTTTVTTRMMDTTDGTVAPCGITNEMVLDHLNRAKDHEFPNSDHMSEDDWFRRRYNVKQKIGGSLSSTSPETTYVGLVNQAMTCYLNSLLQALYMTPEFRNALYKWEYVEGTDNDQSTSIPFQLQKLFLNLQTSTKSAVETTSLTKSFGWDSSEAWQQHDIQELCRVMFDALEQKFKNTEQAELINQLYEGKMIDYVKCLKCNTEKSREDKFLDIPLPVRPFDSNIAYNSVEEALRAFVKYETLDGNNQYHCEKCNKKCDAQKGLKFTKFPYLLTLHLKRFDFDCNSFHRIKLNDKVTFPDVLDLNSFIDSTSNQESPSGEEDIGLSVRCDDSSTTDSGTLDDDCPPCENNMSNSHQSNPDQDDDEGIDMSNGLSTSSYSSHSHENEKNRICAMGKSPYIYELFAIMIHSGSASGGHYYAYIKDFQTQEWLCFNDQCVSRITQDDIAKTYGGGPSRAYYSSAYSSSTNAYMLMYRQIDHLRNTLPMQKQDFPEHIKKLLSKMEEDSLITPICEHPVQSVLIYCHHPKKQELVEKKVSYYAKMSLTWEDMAQRAYEAFKLEDVVEREQCRLVAFKSTNGAILQTFDAQKLFSASNFELLLQIREANKPFVDVLPLKIYTVMLNKEEVGEEPITLRCGGNMTVWELKENLAQSANIEPKDMQLVLQRYPATIKLLEDNDETLTAEGVHPNSKIYMAPRLRSDTYKSFRDTLLYDIVEKYENVITMKLKLPDTSQDILEERDIPSLGEENEEKEKLTPVMNGHAKPIWEFHEDTAGPKSSEMSDENAVQEVKKCDKEDSLFEFNWNSREQSNSEDSSLSDSDKTLVGDPPEEDELDKLKLQDTESDDWDVEEEAAKKYFFKAFPPDIRDDEKCIRVMVDRRISMNQFRKALEPYIGVSSEYFKIYHSYTETKFMPLVELSRFDLDEETQVFQVQLIRPLRSGEYKLKLFQLVLDSSEPYKFLYEFIGCKGMTVSDVKKKILHVLKRRYNVDIPYEKCRLRKRGPKSPFTIFMDDQVLDEDIHSTVLLIQELPDKEFVTSNNQTVLFVKKWSPSEMQFGKFQEVVLKTKLMSELQEKISEISDIPVEHLQLMSGAGKEFPCDMSVMMVQNLSQWNETVKTIDKWPFQAETGSVIFYRDSREKPKELNEAERLELNLKEMIRLKAQSSSAGSIPRRERVLRIHLLPKSSC